MTGFRRKINFIARTNGAGLDRDVDLVVEPLGQAGHEIKRRHCRDAPFWHRSRLGAAHFDINIFVERVLKKIDHILCKIHHALEIFSKHHRSSHFSSFTSDDLQHQGRLAREWFLMNDQKFRKNLPSLIENLAP